MAYQTKSYRKFVATAATAALVASAVAPAASAASVSQFKDVAAKYQDAVKYLVDNGITEGTSKTTFGTYDSVKRGDAAVWIAKALKLDTSKAPDAGFKDVNSRVAGAVNALYAAKIISGKSATSFAPDATLTRGEMAKIIANAYNLESNKDVPFKDLGPTFGPYIKALYEFGITTGTSETTFGTGNNITRGDFAIFLKRASEVKVDAAVLSVSAVNAKQVEVKFSKAVDASTIFSDVSNGTLNSGVISVKRTADAEEVNKNVDSASDTFTGALSADGKTLTLTLDVTSAKYFDGTYSATVSDAVKATDNQKIEAFAGTFTVSDKVAPTVKEVVYNTITNEVEVTFSEPVTAVPNVVRLAGQPITNATFVNKSNQTKIKFSKPTSVEAGSTKSVYVAETRDAANNILTPYTGNVTFTNDASALAVASVSQISSNKAKVVFNKSVASNDATIDGALKVILDGTLMDDANVTAALDTNDSSKKTVVVTFGGTAPEYFYGTSASKTLTFVFAADAVTDVFGKKLSATTQNVVMTKDVTGPKVVSAKLAANGADIEVTFDEEIAATGTVANIVLRKDGVAMNAPATAVKKAGNGNEKVLVITPATADLVSGKLPGGTYTVRLDEDAIRDLHTNKNAPSTTTVTKDAVSTELTALIANQAGPTHNVFEVTYSEDVTTASALNLANYKLDGAALPTGTDIYFKLGAANRTVVIELPNESINIGNVNTPANASLAVSGVQTSNGKTVVPNSAAVTVIDNTSAVLKTATLVGSNILKLTFDENLDPNITFADVADILDDIEVSNGTVTFADTDTTHNASISGKDLIITFSAGTGSNWASATTGTVTVKTLSGGSGSIVDANGVKVKANISVPLTK